MGLLKLTENLKKIAFIGLAKNTGKTVAMQVLINELTSNEIVFGITSIGHDGEKFDQINNLIQKPRIFLPRHALVATTDRLLNEGTTINEIILQTDYFTPLGRVCIAKILKEGEIEVAGPSTANGITDVTDKMLSLGAEKVLIDGAINRKAIANPELSDGIFIATGAVLSAGFNNVIKETVKTLESFLLPSSEFVFKIGTNDEDLSCFVNGNHEVVGSFKGMLLNNKEKVSFFFEQNNLSGLITFKSITETFLDFLLFEKKKKGITKLFIVVHDHTKLFLDNKSVMYYNKKGIELVVMKPLNVLAITVNPVAPMSHSFKSDKLVDELKNNISDIPVFDVLSPGFK